MRAGIVVIVSTSRPVGDAHAGYWARPEWWNMQLMRQASML